ncbi:MAG: hypothetical protein C7B45_16690 [Sulfobacillus acidophilus]|uniref:Uncharacterized protein n=1 Tax=Sulfobacillus acidophilus TaxID=53633 RepID=A0A2T2WCV8_9FIRM|nr:MAG: hypothetical protein C7B45_16690 [Sulfobacillus acidophilus]
MVHHACFEPFAHEMQKSAIANAVGHHLAHPVMLDMVEIAANVRLEDPAGLVQDDVLPQPAEGSMSVAARMSLGPTLNRRRYLRRSKDSIPGGGLSPCRGRNFTD